MRFRYLLLLLFLAPLSAVAQYSSNNGLFQVQEIKGCAPFTVNITSWAGGPLAPFSTKWGDGQTGNPPPNPTTHTYTQPNTYTLQVDFQSGTGSDIITITVTPNIQ